MSRRRSVLHSEKRHRTRNYKRRLKNLLIELILIIILIFVATKFVKKDEEKPEIKKITAEEQKEIIKEQLEEKNNNKNEKELKIPEIETRGLEFTKATVNYIKESQQSIINVDIKNNDSAIEDARILIAILDENKQELQQTYIDIQYLGEGQQTRVSIVIDKDLSNAYEIETREEN